MAAIDKTYAQTWKEYQEVVNWAKENIFICPNGIAINPLNSIYGWTKESFEDGKKLPILNTSQSLDYFLIKYCPIKLIQDRMLEVYDQNYINSIKNGTSEYDTFIRPKSGTKVRMIQNSKFHNKKPFRFYSQHRNKRVITLFVEVEYNNQDLLYNENYDKFIIPFNELGEWTSSSAVLNCKSIKAVIRKILKWKLPKDSIVTVNGRYIGETWKFIVK